MRAYLSTQLGIATPVESEWGLFNHLGGDALDLVHAEMEAVKRPLTWTETCTLLTNAFVDLTHNTIHLGEQLDAFTFQEFDGKGGLVAFCHKYQSLATKLGSRRSNEDHIKHLYDILPGRMCNMLNAKFDFSQSVKLTDVLHALRTSRFGLESASSTAKSKDSRSHAGHGHNRHGPSTRGGYTPRGGSAPRGAYHNRGSYNNNPRPWQRASSDANGPVTPHQTKPNSGYSSKPHDNKRRRTAFEYVRENKVVSPNLCAVSARLSQCNATQLASDPGLSYNVPNSDALKK
jgi:hypothetical protein